MTQQNEKNWMQIFLLRPNLLVSRNFNKINNKFGQLILRNYKTFNEIVVKHKLRSKTKSFCPRKITQNNIYF